jgi:hypothetical protein
MAYDDDVLELHHITQTLDEYMDVLEIYYEKIIAMRGDVIEMMEHLEERMDE